MKKQILLLIGLGMFFANHADAQVTTGEGFEAAAFPPTGWLTVGAGGGPGAATWSRRTNATTGATAAGTTPAATTFSGSGMARFTCRNTTAGGTQSLCSPVIDLSKRGSQNSYVTVHVYRDTQYSTDDSLTIWFNTARNLTGAKRLGGISRYAKKTNPDSVAQGWHKYSFAIPGSFTGTTNYFLIQGTSRGAGSAGNIFIDSVIWDAYPTYCAGKPTAGTITASQYKICGNSAFINLSLSGQTTATGSSFSWQLSNDSVTFTTQNAWNNNANPAGNFASTQGVNRWIRVISYCNQSGLYDTSKWIKIYFVAGTAPIVRVTPNNTAVCLGSTTPAKLVASGAKTYTWSPATGLNTTTGDTVYALPTANSFYTILGTDSIGCTGQAFAQVQVQTGPTVLVAVVDTMLCQGDSTQLTANVQGGFPGAVYTYLWSNGATTKTASGIAYGAANTYSVTVKNQAGCETVKSVNITGVLKPSAALSYTVVSGRTVNFKFAGSNAANVYWNYSDGNESFQQNPTYTFSADGTYKVMCVANNPPCGADTVYMDVKVTATNGVVNNVLDYLVVMPNPAVDAAWIKFNGIEKELQVNVMDATGRKVMVQNYSQVNGSTGVQLPIAQLPAGLYRLQIKSEKGMSFSALQVVK